MADPIPYAWLPLGDLLAQLGIPEGHPNVPTAEAARGAAAADEQRHRPDLLGPDGYAPDADVVLGAVLVAARLYARRGSPVGLASFGDFGTSVPRLDPDAERLLGLGVYGRPRIG